MQAHLSIPSPIAGIGNDKACDRFTSYGDVMFPQRLAGGAAIFAFDVLCGSTSFSGLLF
jgi:hypothetical protein